MPTPISKLKAETPEDAVLLMLGEMMLSVSHKSIMDGDSLIPMMMMATGPIEKPALALVSMGALFEGPAFYTKHRAIRGLLVAQQAWAYCISTEVWKARPKNQDPNAYPYGGEVRLDPDRISGLMLMGGTKSKNLNVEYDINEGDERSIDLDHPDACSLERAEEADFIGDMVGLLRPPMPVQEFIARKKPQ